MKANTKKALVLAACAVMIVCAMVFSTIAFFTASSDTKENTFTIGNIKIALDETPTALNDADESDGDSNNHYKLVPGSAIAKDPKVTVKGGSEDCYVFIKVEKGGNVDEYIEYAIGSSWKVIDEENGIYAYEEVVESADTDTELDSILENDEVTVDSDVTEITEGDVPTLTFTAYAVQAETFSSAESAWNATFGAVTD